MVTMVSIKVRYAQAVHDLAVLGEVLDSEKVLNAIGLRQMSWMSANVKGGGYPSAWQQMSENTLAAKPQRSSSHNFASRYQSQLLQGMTVEVQAGKSVEVGINAPYVEFHHEGTQPYTIRPVKGQFLAFQVAGGNFATRLGIAKPIRGSTAMVFTKEVHHPGLPARPMLPSKMVAEQLAFGVIEAIVKKSFDAFAAKSNTLGSVEDE